MRADDYITINETKNRVDNIENNYDRTLKSFESSFEKIFDKLDDMIQRQTVYEQKVLNLVEVNLNLKNHVEKNKEDLIYQKEELQKIKHITDNIKKSNNLLNLEKEKISLLLNKVDSNEKTLNNFIKVIWLIISALIASIIKILFFGK